MILPSYGSTALTTALALVLGTSLPAAAAPATPADGPVTVIGLTDVVGDRTAAAVDGLDDLEDGAQPAPEDAPAQSPAEDGTEQPIDDPGEAPNSPAGTLEAAGISGLSGAGVARSVPIVRAAAGAVEEDIAVLTAPMETERFFVAGLTWDADSPLPQDAQIFMRVLEDGQWTPWSEVEPEEATNDEGDDPDGQAGTDPYVTGGADGIQLQVSADVEALPSGLELSLIPENPGESAEVLTESPAEAATLPTEEPTARVETASAGTSADQNVRLLEAASATADPAATVTQAALTTATAQPAAVSTALSGAQPQSLAAEPTVMSRRGWGANESYMKWGRINYAPLRAAVVHHTAGSNNYGWADAPGVVRGIYYYHAVTRGWGDIGYNFLIDKWGRVYEGRTGSLSAPAGTMPQGAHASDYNTGSLGISAMGDFTKVPVTDVIMNTMADVIAWKFAAANVDMSTPSGFISPGTTWRPKGQNLPRVFAHRDVAYTTCPGNDIYGRIGALNQAVSAKSKVATVTLEAMIYMNNDFDVASDIQFRFGDPDGDIFVGDWNGNGTDSVAVRTGDTFKVRYWHSSGEPNHTFHYGRAGDDVLAGDWDGDGTTTLAVRRGNEYHIKNSVTGGDADVVLRYGRKDDQVLVGDWNQDGKDTFAVRRGKEFHVRNTLTSGNADSAFFYGKADDVVLVGDWDGDGEDTFAVRRSDTYHLKNAITGGPADIVFTYGRASDEPLVGDWNGNGQDTMGLRRG